MKRTLAVLFFIIMPIISWAGAPMFKAGSDFDVIAKGVKPTGKIIVVREFFSYECPWCYRLEGELEKWLATKPKDVQFERVPVSYNQAMSDYAKVFYVAKALRVENKINKPLFEAIHVEKRDMTNTKALIPFFEKYGVSSEDFLSAYNFSMSIDAHIAKANAISNKLNIMGVPSIVVDDRYRTDARLNRGNSERMMAVVRFLIQRARADRQ